MLFQPPSRVLLVRNDALGDALTTLPTGEALRRAFPRAEVTVLAGKRNEWLFRRAGYPVLTDPLDFRGTIALLREYRPQIAVVASPRERIPLALLAAGVPLRVGYGYRSYGLAFNRPAFIHRSSSHAHEAALTLALLRPLGIHPKSYAAPRLTPTPDSLHCCKELLEELAINNSYSVIHPGGGGSAPRWSVANYAGLAQLLMKSGTPVLLTGSPAEAETLDSIIALAPGAVSLAGRSDLDLLAALIFRCDCFVSGSTGPMHLAAALGVRQVALFSSEKSVAPERWHPLNHRATVICSESDDMDDITAERVFSTIDQRRADC